MKILLDNKCYADAKRAFDYIDQRLFYKEEWTVYSDSPFWRITHKTPHTPVQYGSFLFP